MEGILLIGGGGFLGSALASRFVGFGYEVHIITPNGIPILGKNLIIHKGRLDNEKLLKHVLPDCKTVFHLASATTPASSAENPFAEGEQNILPTLKFLDVFQHYENIPLIFISSGGTLYGNPEKLPVGEDFPLRPRSYHGAGKVAIEAFLGAYASHSGSQVTILRPSNLYGPGQSLRKGFGVIRTILEHLRQGTTMEIWGDGETVRDFLYIGDMVDICHRLVESSPKNQIYNVGSGIGHSVNQIKQIAEAVIGKRLKVRHRPIRHVDIKRVVLDISKIKGDTGWRPEVELSEGIQRTWNWVLEQ